MLQFYPSQKLLNTHPFFALKLNIGKTDVAVSSSEFQMAFIITNKIAGLYPGFSGLIFRTKYF